MVLSRPPLNRKSQARELLAKYTTFNDAWVDEQINSVYQLDDSFHLREPVVLRHIARKRGLSDDRVWCLYEDLMDTDRAGERTLLVILSQTLKYAVRHGGDITFLELIKAFELIDYEEVRSELIWALAYKIQIQKQLPSEEDTLQKLNALVESSAPYAGKFFLLTQMNRYGEIDRDSCQIAAARPGILGSLPAKATPKLEVTKQQQVTKTTYKNRHTEESAIDILDLVEALRNKHKQAPVCANGERVPAIDNAEDASKSDKEWYRGTYAEVRHLYNRTQQNEPLSREDIDYYLTDKFLDKTHKGFSLDDSHKWFAYGTSGSFFIDRMICNIFNTVSERQRLNAATIKKLMQCVDSLDHLKQAVFDTNNDAIIASEMVDQYILKQAYEGEPKIISEVASCIYGCVKGVTAGWVSTADYQYCDEGKVIEIVVAALDAMRLDAISAIYNSVLRNQSILSAGDIKEIERCLNDQHQPLQRMAIKILAVLRDTDKVDYAKLFKAYLSQLAAYRAVEGEEIEAAINYISQQSQNESRCLTLFNLKVIFKIITCLHGGQLDDQQQLRCLDIIHSYLQYKFTLGLSPEHLNGLMRFINNTTNETLQVAVLKIILLSSEKSEGLPEHVISELLGNIKALALYSANLIVMILGNMPDMGKINFNLLSFKLLDTNVIQQEEDDIQFPKRSEENEICLSISALVAKIIVGSLSASTERKMTRETLSDLVKGVASLDKQTRILSAKALFLGVSNDLIEVKVDDADLLSVQNYLYDPIVDVSVYTKIFYADSLCRRSLSSEALLPAVYVDSLIQMYVVDALYLGKTDFSQRVNSAVLEILRSEAKKGQTLNSEAFKIFDYVLFSGKGDPSLCLEIIEHVVFHSDRIPERTVEALENLLDGHEHREKTLKLLSRIIKNGQAVGEKTLSVFVELLYVDEDVKVRAHAFECLCRAEVNQDVPDAVFDVLEVERAGASIARSSPERNNAFDALEKATLGGQKLPLNLFYSLVKERKINERSFKVLKNAAVVNKQRFPDGMLDALASQFNPKAPDSKLIELFFHLIQNNQVLPKGLTEKLQKALTGNTAADDVLLIFILKGQRGERLAPAIIDKIFAWSSRIHECSDKSDVETSGNKRWPLWGMSQFFWSSVAAIGQVFPDSARSILAWPADEKRTPNADMGRHFGLSITAMKQASLASIFSILQQPNGADYVRRAERILIQNLKESNSRLLKITIEGFDLLHRKGALSQEAITALIQFAGNTQDNEIRAGILKILHRSNHLDAAQRSALTLINLASELSEVGSDEDYLKQCAAPPDQARLFETNFRRINQIISSRADLHAVALKVLLACSNKGDMPRDLQKNISIIALSSASHDIKQLAEQLIEGVSDSSAVEEKLETVPLQESNAHQLTSDKTTLEIIQAIISGEVSVAWLCAYKKRIPTLSKDDLEQTTAALIAGLSEGGDHKNINVLMLECVVILSRYIENPADCQCVLEKYMESDNARIRSVCFKGLSALQEAGHASPMFEQYCHDLQAAIKAETQQTVDDWDLIDTIVALNYVNFPNDLPQAHWTKNLIMSDWAEKYGLDDSQKIVLYMRWTNVEKYLLDPNKGLKLLHHVDGLSFEELSEIITFLPAIDFENFCTILTSAENVYEALRPVWLKTMLVAPKLPLADLEESYVDAMVCRVAKKLPVGLAEKLINSIDTISGVIEFESIVDFVCQHNISKHQIDRCATIADLRAALERKILKKCFKETDQTQLTKLLNSLSALGWTFDNLFQLLTLGISDNSSNRRGREANLFQAMTMVVEYNVLPKQAHDIREVLERGQHEDWVSAVNDMILEHYFPPAGVVKNAGRLIAELQEDNSKGKYSSELPQATLVQKLIDGGLLSAMENVNSSDLLSNICCRQLPIAKWDREQIAEWAGAVKSTPDYFKAPCELSRIIEFVAVAKRANFLVTGFQLTNTQILSCLVAVYGKENRGRLLQVATGEGKTILISILAILQALQGHKVDIVTSSPVHAEEGARGQAPLYRLFGLTADDNRDRLVYTSGEKACYQKDIVYGEAAQFQFDTLRDEYSALGTLGGRQCHVAILDEVDSMLIDDGSKIAKLASTVAGMDQLQPIYYFLWQRINELQKRIVSIDGKFYLLYGMMEYEEDRMALYYEAGEERIKIPDLKKYVNTTKDISHIGQHILGDLDTFLENHLKDYLKELLEDKVLKIPAHFEKFVNDQTPRWVGNAMVALSEFQESMHYIVRQGSIKPVAFNSNGTVQSATNWSDGLHQFLQMKHGVDLTSETLNTNFLSNIAYFRRYGSRLFGFTGTLGSAKAQAVLSDTYHVDCIKIPSVCEKRYQSLPTRITENQADHLDQICSEMNRERKKGRGVLVICKTIRDAQLVEEMFRSKHRAAVIKTYTVNDNNEEKAVESIASGECIIATNIAGRGTDIKTDDAIERAGGMHVILTFMPENVRVEEQALGRTARQGKLGTGRRIVNKQVLVGYHTLDVEHLAAERDALEAQQLDHFRGRALSLIEAKDNLFVLFCGLIKSIRKDIREKSHGVWKDLKAGVTALFADAMPSVYEGIIVSAIEERWAMFLRRMDDGEIDIGVADREYKALETAIRRDYQSGQLVENPYHHIAIANDLLFNETYFSDIRDEASRHFDAAIKKDRAHSAPAFVGKAWLILKAGKSGAQDYKQQAIHAFEEALVLLSDEVACLMSVQASWQREGMSNTGWMKQLTQKINLLSSYANGVEAAVDSIRKSQRLITLTQSNTSQSVVHFGLERRADGRIDPALTNDERYSVQFNDLTMRADTGIVDQAGSTISAAFEGESRLDSNYKGVSILLQHLNLADIQSFLNADLEYQAIKKAAALEKLKERASALEKLAEKASFLQSFSKFIFPSGKEINLEIISVENTRESKKNISVSDAIKRVSECHENSQINLTFLNANETVKHLSVKYLKLSHEEVDKKLGQIRSSTVDLELSGSREALLAAVEPMNVASIQLFASEKMRSTISTVDKASAMEKLRRDKASAMEKLRQADDEPVTVRVVGLKPKIAQAATKYCKDLEISATFNEVNVSDIKKLKEGQVNVRLTQLTPSTAKPLISQLRKANIELAVCFEGLMHSQATSVIRKADLKQEEVEISRVRPLSELFPKADRPEQMLSEFAARGMEHVLELNEKRFIPWRSVCSVSMLAMVQMAAGAALVSTGFGVDAGIGLIAEGTGDVLTVYRAYSTRRFTWVDYCKQKAVSLVISTTCIGWRALKDAGKGTRQLLVGMGEEAVERAAIGVVSQGGRGPGQIAVQAGRELKVLARKQMTVTLVENSARESLNQLTDTFSHFCFEQVRPQILSSVQDKVHAAFHDSLSKKLLTKMYALDGMGQSQVLNSKIEYIVRDTFNSQQAFWQEQWSSIGWPLCRGILSDSKYLGTPFSMSMRAVGVLQGMHQIASVIKTARDQVERRLSKLNDEILSIAQLLQTFCPLNENIAVGIAALLKEQGIIDEKGDINSTALQSAKLGQYDAHKTEVLLFLARLANRITQVDVSPALSLLSDTIADHIIAVAEQQLISPLSSYATAGIVNNLSSRVQDKLNRSQLTAKMQAKEEELGLLEQKAERTPEEHNEARALESDLNDLSTQLAYEGPMTYAMCIAAPAKTRAIALSHCDMILFPKRTLVVTHDGESQQPIADVPREVSDYANAVSKDKPAELIDMIAMASANGMELGVDFKIVNDPDYQITQEDREQNTKIVVLSKGSEDFEGNSGIGHWSVMDEKGQLTDIASEGNNCGYAIFSEWTKKSVEQLRAETSRSMTENTENFSKAIEARDWLVSHYPKEANTLLFAGGKKKGAPQPIRYNKDGIKFGLTPGIEVDREAVNQNEVAYTWDMIENFFNCADAVYDDNNNDKQVPGKALVSTLETDHLAFSACAYLDPKTNQMIIAFKGSDKWETWFKDNWKLATKDLPRSAREAAPFIKRMMDEYPDTPVSFTGHSLGASIATYFSSEYKKPAVCFENPGIGKKVKIDDSQVMSFQALPNVINKLHRKKGNIFQLPSDKSMQARLSEMPGVALASHTRAAIRKYLRRAERLCTGHSVSDYLTGFMRDKEHTKIKYLNERSAIFIKHQIYSRAPSNDYGKEAQFFYPTILDAKKKGYTWGGEPITNVDKLLEQLAQGHTISLKPKSEKKKISDRKPGTKHCDGSDVFTKYDKNGKLTLSGGQGFAVKSEGSACDAEPGSAARPGC